MADKKQAARGSDNSGAGRGKSVRPAPLKGDQERDRAITALPENKRVKVLMPDMHLKLMSVPEYEAYLAARDA